MPGPARQPAFIVIPTHTARYLDLVLAGLARQTERPAAVVVSCDGDDEAIGSVVRGWAPRVHAPVAWVRRKHHGEERLCQARNNAVRALVAELSVRTGRLITLDGDMIATDTLVERHVTLGEGAGVVYPYRANVTEGASAALRADQLLAGEQRPALTDDEATLLERRHRRYERHLLLRRLHLVPAHKPKLLGGHFSCALDLYLRLNGFDEEYVGWGFKDDDFARRAARAGVGCRVAVRDIVAFHLFHPTRQAPGRMADLPTARRFARRDLPLACEHGVSNPLPQHDVRTDWWGR